MGCTMENNLKSNIIATINSLSDCIKIEDMNKSLECMGFKEICISHGSNINDIDFETNKGIYVFTIEFGEEKNSIGDFRNIWKNRTEEKVPRLNDGETSNNYLYVGRALSGLKARINAHFGKGSEGTYSLKLGKITNLQNFDITCHVFVLGDELEENVQSAYISMIEAILHEKCNPILGKK